MSSCLVLSDKRLQKNDVNYAIGYDIINATNDPYIEIFRSRRYQKIRRSTLKSK